MASEALEIGVAQLRVEPGVVASNRERALDAIAEGAARGLDLVALPELFTVGYFAFDAYESAAEAIAGETLTAIREAAAAHEIAVLAGSIVEDLSATECVPTPAAEGLANTATLFDADGEHVLTYRKHHLFGYESAESTLLVPGERLETATIGPFTVGVTTCYDLRFPELYRRYGAAGVDLVFVPSAWPYPRVHHWETLPRARAIENQCYVVTINGTGHFPDADATLLGRSTVYDPWGVPVAASGDRPTTVTATLEADRVQSVREAFPALEDRRPSLLRDEPSES